MAETGLAAALIEAHARLRALKSAGQWDAATECNSGKRHFDVTAHAAYYSVFHKVIGRSLRSRHVDLRVTPKRYGHKEIPGLAGKCIGNIVIVAHRGSARNYKPVQAVLELQGLRRLADYEPLTNDEETGVKAYELATALHKVISWE